MGLDVIIQEARSCRLCEEVLPLGPRPLIQGSEGSRVLVIGQAPGAVAHETGIPWNDRSGVRLRGWLGIADEVFYDPERVALMPMGFCYPGKGRSGDLAPRPECAPRWHEQMLGAFRHVGLIVIVGGHAASRYAPRGGSITSLARDFAAWLPDRIVIPHPSPRNGLWLRKNPWFEAEAVPALQARVRELLAGWAGSSRPTPRG